MSRSEIHSSHLCHHPVHWKCVSSQSNEFQWQHHSCFPRPRPMARKRAEFCDIMCHVIVYLNRVNHGEIPTSESHFLLLLSYLDLQSLTQRRKHLCEDNLLVPHRGSCGLLSGRATLRNKVRLLNEDKQRNDGHVGSACLTIYLYTLQTWLIMSTKINNLNRSPQYNHMPVLYLEMGVVANAMSQCLLSVYYVEPKAMLPLTWPRGTPLSFASKLAWWSLALLQ